MSRLTLRLPETLHHQLEVLAQHEEISLNQYIVYALTRQVTLAYAVQSVPDKAIAEQRVAYTALLESLGDATFPEIEQALAAREVAAPESDLSPEAVGTLQQRIAGTASAV
jgi:hypothetical protein